MKEHIPRAPTAWRRRTSSYSQPDGGNCVELGWRKSSSSQANGNSNCVELVPTLDALRDSKNPTGPVLISSALPILINQIKSGQFNR